MDGSRFEIDHKALLAAAAEDFGLDPTELERAYTEQFNLQVDEAYRQWVMGYGDAR